MQIDTLFTESFFKKNNYFENKLNLSVDTIKGIKAKIMNWQIQIETHTKGVDKETSDSGEFIKVVFEDILGYHGKGKDAVNYTHYSEFPIKGAGVTSGSGSSDCALGYFSKTDQNAQVLVEFKDPNSNDLEKISSRSDKLSPVDQCWNYLNTYNKATWGIVTNYNEIRLYHKNSSKNKYEVFYFIVPDELKEHKKPLSDEKELFKFITLLKKENLLAKEGQSYTESILEQQGIEEKKIQTDFYIRYKTLRADILEKTIIANPEYNNVDDGEKNKHELLTLVQKFMDRIIFCWFCEDSREQLLQSNILDNIIEESLKSKFYSKSGNDIYSRLNTLFKAIDIGGNYGISIGYNGGLFKDDKTLESLHIPNEIFEEIANIGEEYDFGEDSSLNVNILGHIFEQSISDLEEMKSSFDNTEFDATKSKRKKDGVFYTPEYITNYIVENTVGAWLKEKFEYLEKKYSTETIDKEFKILSEYKDKYLSKINIVDPACGSGAFLIAAFDYLYVEHKRVTNQLNILNVGYMFDATEVDKAILENNLYGVDINSESVEITKLSLWLKTAKKDKKLSSLDDNIQCGNSLIDDETIAGNKAFKWEEKFSKVFADTLPVEFEKGINEIDPFFFNECILPKLTDEEKTFIVSKYNIPAKKGAFQLVEFSNETLTAITGIFMKHFNDKGFDVVIGNPPYVLIEDVNRNNQQLNFYRNQYKCASYKIDTYHLFIERGINLISSTGKMGFITPSNYLTNNGLEKLRNYILDNSYISELNIISGSVFKGVSVDTSISIFERKKEITLLSTTKYSIWNGNELNLISSKSYDQIVFKNNKFQLFTSTVSTELNVNCFPLAKNFNVKFGMQLRDRKIYISDVITKDQVSLITSYHKSCYTGKDVSRYFMGYSNLLAFINKEAQSGGCWDESIHKTNPKIILRQIGQHPICCLDEKGFYCLNTVFMITPKETTISIKYLLIILNSKYIQNYWVENFFDNKQSFPKIKGSYLEQLPIPEIPPEAQTPFIEKADVMLSLNKTLHEKSEKFKKEILKKYTIEKLNNKLDCFYELSFEDFCGEIKKVAKLKPLSAKEERAIADYWEELFNDDKKELLALKEQIDRTDWEIDRMVYELYGLTDDEVAIVEGEK